MGKDYLPVGAGFSSAGREEGDAVSEAGECGSGRRRRLSRKAIPMRTAEEKNGIAVCAMTSELLMGGAMMRARLPRPCCAPLNMPRSCGPAEWVISALS